MRFSVFAKTVMATLTAGLTACTTAPVTDTKPATAAPRPAIGAPAIAALAAANMANNCFACHGPRGVSPGTIPSLHNLTADNIAESMKAFKTGARPGTVMGRHAKGYSDPEIDAIARHIASLNKR
jgi:sulfide dehydrogenase cytochrome subunit